MSDSMHLTVYEFSIYFLSVVNMLSLWILMNSFAQYRMEQIPASYEIYKG